MLNLSKLKHALHVMVDLETLSTKSNSAVLSIGISAGMVQIEKENRFYLKHNLILDTMPNTNKRIDEEVLDWWANQDIQVWNNSRVNKIDSKKSVELISKCDKRNILLNLASKNNEIFSTVQANTSDIPVYWWGNGIDFDLVILGNLIEGHGFKKPWTYKDQMCFRTLRSLFSDIPKVKPSLMHDALADSEAQLDSLLSWLKSKP